MSDDYVPSFEEMSFDEMRGTALDPADLLTPDIDQYLEGYEPQWLDAWEAVPWDEIHDGQEPTDAQIDAFIDMLSDMPFEDWPDWDDPNFDFWEWWEENYG